MDFPLQTVIGCKMTFLFVHLVCSPTTSGLSMRARSERHPVDEKSPCNEQLKRSGHTENIKRLPLDLRQIWLTLISSASPRRNPLTTALFAEISFITPLSAGTEPRARGFMIIKHLPSVCWHLAFGIFICVWMLAPKPQRIAKSY